MTPSTIAMIPIARSGSRGFTLVELMVVVAIIGILAVVAIPQYRNYAIRSQVAEGLSVADGYKTAVSDYYSQHGAYPSTNQSANVSPASGTQTSYVTSVNVAPGLITVQFGNKANTAISGKTLELSSSASAGTLQWSCKSGTLDPAYLPSGCR